MRNLLKRFQIFTNKYNYWSRINFDWKNLSSWISFVDIIIIKEINELMNEHILYIEKYTRSMFSFLLLLAKDLLPYFPFYLHLLNNSYNDFNPTEI